MGPLPPLLSPTSVVGLHRPRAARFHLQGTVQRRRQAQQSLGRWYHGYQEPAHDGCSQENHRDRACQEVSRLIVLATSLLPIGRPGDGTPADFMSYGVLLSLKASCIHTHYLFLILRLLLEKK